ncbi:EAL domain-containing protein [Neobacillus sp. MM2021_6]|uniref:sensor domain-containing protein n=1 Tax=Bacillaceae TaxID=186817 RepID=UPI0014085C9C|nr:MULTISPECIES: EAL domain-containing protein [Bacillaceae]MBO0959343.1 EAL domain-containing protein [Neobacillus sp. MM2021_6]
MEWQFGIIELCLIGITIFLCILIVLYIYRKFSVQSKRIKTSEQYYHSLYHNNPDIILTLDVKGTLLSANQVVESYGYSVDELLQRPFVSYVVPELVKKTMKHFTKSINGEATNYETAIFSKVGDQVQLNVTSIPIINEGEIVGAYAILKDITSFKQTQEALVEAESTYRSLVEESLVGIYIIENGKFVYVNPQLLEWFGYTNEETIGSYLSDYIHPEDVSIVLDNIQKRFTDENKGMKFQYRAIKKDQSIIHLEVYGSKTIYRGKQAVIGSVIDITEQKKAEEKIKHMAYHDALTDLPNRYLFTSSFQTALSNQSMETASILFLDLDRFKLINDSLGHDLGDLLLKKVSERLKNCICPEDCLARLGGDEFIFFLPNVGHEGTTKTLNQVLTRLNEPFHLNEYEMYITPSIGISQYPHDGEDIGTLIKKADLAMNQAKRLGKNNFQYYIQKSMEQTNDVLEMEKDLRRAIERNEFRLYYQPKLDVYSGEIIGVEALIRWQHSQKGIISPGQFIPLAEETGLIISMGEWVLRTACAEMKAFQELGFPSMIVSVNLSLRQFFQPNFVQMVSQVLSETGLSPEFIELEITESMTIDTHHALMVVQELKKLGVKISLDDFGTGYSSLHYLKQFPIDKLKIDQSFIRDCVTNTNNATIVKTIIAMAHQLNMEIIAEGVETEGQLHFLQENLCPEVQGFLFCRPLPLDEIKENFYDLVNAGKQYSVSREPKNLISEFAV